MKQNVRSGFRAGGRAPYGYRLKEVPASKHLKGGITTKTILEPNPPYSEIITEYFERRAKRENIRAILKDFYKRGILSPSGNRHWSPHSARSIEGNLEVYLGHTIFNRHNEKKRAWQ